MWMNQTLNLIIGFTSIIVFLLIVFIFSNILYGVLNIFKINNNSKWKAFMLLLGVLFCEVIFIYFLSFFELIINSFPNYPFLFLFFSLFGFSFLISPFVYKFEFFKDKMQYIISFVLAAIFVLVCWGVVLLLN